jgi:hypothetical protein
LFFAEDSATLAKILPTNLELFFDRHEFKVCVLAVAKFYNFIGRKVERDYRMQ